MTLTLQPNAAAVGVPTLSVEGDRLVVTSEGQSQSHPVAEVSLAAFTYRVRNTQTAGLKRYNVLLEDRSGQPVAWLGNLDVEPYPGAALSEFAAGAGIPLQVRGEVPFSAVSHMPAETRVGPGTSRAGMVAAPLRQWILCLAVIGAFAPIVVYVGEKWSNGWLLLLLAVWFFGSFFVVGVTQSGMDKAHPAWVRKTRRRTVTAAAISVLGGAVGVLGYQGIGPVPGWLGVWVAAGGLILLSGRLLALQGTWRRA